MTVYESVLEGDNGGDAGKDMQIDGEEKRMNIRFRELPYTVETGEAEMIGVDTIAKGSGTATRTETLTSGVPASSSKTSSDKETKDGERSSQAVLSQEEEELIASLNTRLNAVRTLESRISLIKSYVSNISDTESSDEKDASSPQLSHTILRNINSLISHLSILSPHEQSAFASEVLSQSNDVLLVSLLGQIGQNVKSMRELGRKSHIIQSARHANNTRRGPALAERRLEDEMFSHSMPSTGESAYS